MYSLWPRVAAAARYAIDIRFRLLDYFYTAFYVQTMTGKPSLNPMFYIYPTDRNTFGVDGQFFYGDAVLVSPVLEENSTTVDIYLPDDIFYDWNNGFRPVRGNAANVILSEVGFNTIPLHIRGGCVLPLRTESANTTTELRKKGFELVVAPGLDGTASGSLYLDEGDLIEQPLTTFINFTYSGGSLSMTGDYGYQDGVNIDVVTVLGVSSPPQSVNIGGSDSRSFTYNETTQALTINATITLTGNATVQIGQGLTQPYTGAGTEGRACWNFVGFALTVLVTVWLL